MVLALARVAEPTRARVTETVGTFYRPPWRVDVTVRAGVEVVVPVAALVRSLCAALEAGGAQRPASIGLVLTGDREIASLNEEHLGGSGPTDVLSFPLLPPAAFPAHAAAASVPAAGRTGAVEPTFALPPGRRIHLGDIVVSVERAVAQAAGGRGGWTGNVRWSSAQEMCLLVTHGTLHVCGWDHAEAVEEAAMRALEASLLGPTPPG